MTARRHGLHPVDMPQDVAAQASQVGIAVGGEPDGRNRIDQSHPQ
jgi:hypothetical protein